MKKIFILSLSLVLFINNFSFCKASYLSNMSIQNVSKINFEFDFNNNFNIDISDFSENMVIPFLDKLLKKIIQKKLELKTDKKYSNKKLGQVIYKNKIYEYILWRDETIKYIDKIEIEENIFENHLMLKDSSFCSKHNIEIMKYLLALRKEYFDKKKKNLNLFILEFPVDKNIDDNKIVDEEFLKQYIKFLIEKISKKLKNTEELTLIQQLYSSKNYEKDKNNFSHPVILHFYKNKDVVEVYLIDSLAGIAYKYFEKILQNFNLDEKIKVFFRYKTINTKQKLKNKYINPITIYNSQQNISQCSIFFLLGQIAFFGEEVRSGIQRNNSKEYSDNYCTPKEMLFCDNLQVLKKYNCLYPNEAKKKDGQERSLVELEKRYQSNINAINKNKQKNVDDKLKLYFEKNKNLIPEIIKKLNIKNKKKYFYSTIINQFQNYFLYKDIPEQELENFKMLDKLFHKIILNKRSKLLNDEEKLVKYLDKINKSNLEKFISKISIQLTKEELNNIEEIKNEYISNNYDFPNKIKDINQLRELFSKCIFLKNQKESNLKNNISLTYGKEFNEYVEKYKKYLQRHLQLNESFSKEEVIAKLQLKILEKLEEIENLNKFSLQVSSMDSNFILEEYLSLNDTFPNEIHSPAQLKNIVFNNLCFNEKVDDNLQEFIEKIKQQLQELKIDFQIDKNNLYQSSVFYKRFKGIKEFPAQIKFDEVTEKFKEELYAQVCLNNFFNNNDAVSINQNERWMKNLFYIDNKDMKKLCNIYKLKKTFVNLDQAEIQQEVNNIQNNEYKMFMFQLAGEKKGSLNYEKRWEAHWTMFLVKKINNTLHIINLDSNTQGVNENEILINIKNIYLQMIITASKDLVQNINIVVYKQKNDKMILYPLSHTFSLTWARLLNNNPKLVDNVFQLSEKNENLPKAMLFLDQVQQNEIFSKYKEDKIFYEKVNRFGNAHNLNAQLLNFQYYYLLNRNNLNIKQFVFRILLMFESLEIFQQKTVFFQDESKILWFEEIIKFLEIFIKESEGFILEKDKKYINQSIEKLSNLYLVYIEDKGNYQPKKENNKSTLIEKNNYNEKNDYSYEKRKLYIYISILLDCFVLKNINLDEFKKDKLTLAV